MWLRFVWFVIWNPYRDSTDTVTRCVATDMEPLRGSTGTATRHIGYRYGIPIGILRTPQPAALLQIWNPYRGSTGTVTAMSLQIWNPYRDSMDTVTTAPPHPQRGCISVEGYISVDASGVVCFDPKNNNSIFLP